MAKLPDANSLGLRTPNPNGQIATIGGRGEQLQLAATEKNAATLQSISAQANEADDKLDTAKAKSYFLQSSVKALNSFDKDPDYNTFGQRYTSQMQDVQTQAAGMIKNPMQRELFTQEMSAEVNKGLENVNKQAKIKEADFGVASLDTAITDNRQAALLAPDETTRAALIDATNQSIQAAVDKGYITATQGVLHRQKATQDYATSSVGMLPPEERIAKLRDTENTITKLIPADVNQAMIVGAQNEIRRDQAGFKSDLTSRVKDSQAMAYSGENDPNPPTVEDFKKAYGESAPDQYKSYQEGQKFAYSYFQLSTMKPNEQKDALEKMIPTPGEGYAEQEQRYQAAIKAVDVVNKQRANDPMSFAIDNGLTPVTELHLDVPQALATQLSKRAAIAETMHEDYGTQVLPFTKAEATGMSTMLNKMSAPQRVTYLQSLRDGITDDDTYSQALQQIRPGSPVTAMAGAYLSLDRSMVLKGSWFGKDSTVEPGMVAERLARGESLINPTEEDKKLGIKKLEMPSDNDFQKAFNSYMDGAFRNYPQSAQYGLDASKAYYAALSAEKEGVGSNKIDPDRFNDAMKQTLGDVIDRKGSNILLPWGMNEDSFDIASKPALHNALNKSGLNPEAFKLSDVGFQNSDRMGQYIVTNGTSPLLDKNNLPIIMDLSNNNNPNGRE